MRWIVIFLAACSSSPATPRDTAWQPQTIAHLEARASDWIDHTPDVGENIPCAMSCHTTHAFLVIRPLLGATHPGDTFARVRTRIEQRVEEAGSLRTAVSYYGEPGSAKERESRGTEGILNAATLALADRAAGVPARPITRTAFDRMWEVQRADGGFDWLDFALEPWESSADWGAGLAALATAAMPDDAHAAHRDAIDRLAGFLHARFPAMGLHDRIMLLRTGLATADERAAILRDLAAKQRADGGWSLADWGRGARQAEPHDSDAYATAYATLALCEAGRRDARGLAWLVAHRRPDGGWPGRSVNNDDEQNQLFMSDAATATAAAALVTCR